VLLGLLAGLSGCGGGGGSSGVAIGTDASEPSGPAAKSVSIGSTKPLDAYVVLGGRIKRCWFNADAPLLPKYVYRADVSPDGATVKITIHERADLGRAGIATYAIDFKQSGPSTLVTTENRKMPPELAAKMQYDIDRWKRGANDCNKTMPPVQSTASAPAQPAKPAAKPGAKPAAKPVAKPAAQ
jgi:hypothetical protein